MAQKADVIVIGGGAAGLAAARELSRARFRVVLLEARRRLGGRIDTRCPHGWPLPVELGAEFIHGGNPDLWRLIRRARVGTRKLRERHWLGRGGSVEAIPDLDKEIARVTGLIRPGRAGNRSFASYFRRHPPHGVSPDAWMLARGFVEGFEAAPLGRISARSLSGESLDEEHQYAVPGGYGQVIAALAEDCARHGVKVRRGAAVRSVTWGRGEATVAARDIRTGALREYSARAVVVTLPLGVLKARQGTGAVRFRPPLGRKRAWIDRMGVGDVVRMAVRFEGRALRRLLPEVLRRGGRDGFGFVHSSAKGVPVWWSLSDRPVLVGWAGGPNAKALLRMPTAARRRRALRSLARLLGVKVETLHRCVRGWEGRDWTHDPFSRGAYSFTAAGQDATAARLRRPVRDTLFFAGEATAEGAEVGTVHGALSSGIRAAGEVKRALGSGQSLSAPTGFSPFRMAAERSWRAGDRRPSA